MSLPSSFGNVTEYFTAAVDFLHTYSWVYRDANTVCVKSGLLDSIPTEFRDYFLTISNEQFNTFPFVHELLTGCCPSEVLHFRQQLASLIPMSAFISKDGDIVRRRHKMTLKKQHEIDKLAAHIHNHCTDMQVLVDLGSGLGYLSEALYELNPNYLILGLEVNEGRVLAARQRIRQLFPQTATKSIIYQQTFISMRSRSSIEHAATELTASNQVLHSTMALIGLHACADLSIIAMKLFLAMPSVQRLHIMPCCYHKLALSETVGDNMDAGATSFVNFPMSAALRSVLAGAAGAARCLNRPFLRLACQQTSARWRDCSSEEHLKHGRQMFTRALAEAVCDTDDELLRPHTKCRRVGQAECLTFGELQLNYVLQSRQTGQSVDWQPTHEIRLAELNRRFSNGLGPRLAETLTCLQTAMQKLCENVVLYDRLCYLQETAAVQGLRIKASYEKLFDDKLSPRCFVLIAEKLP